MQKKYVSLRDMRIFSHTLAILAMLLIPAFLRAQEYEFEVTANNKTIWVSKLKVPSNMPLLDFLLTIPELSDRNSDTFLERYDIMLDGKIISDSKDAFLQNTFLREIEKIVINTSPDNTHINNGFSGSIDVVPLSIEKGFSGDVAAQISTGNSVMPTANLRYSNGKSFEARADLNFDIYNPTRFEYRERDGEGYTTSEVDTIRTDYLGQLARLYAKWRISDRDIVKVWFWQNYMYQSTNTSSTFTKTEDMSASHGPGWLFSSAGSESRTDSGERLALNAIVDYERILETGSLKAGADFHSYMNYPGTKDELNMELKSVTNFRIPERQLKLEAAMNFSANSNRDMQDELLYFSPIVKLDFKGKFIKAILNGRYKGYSRNYCASEGLPYNSWASDWTAEANIFWQIRDHHALRLKMVRNTGAAANSLVYPELICDEGSQVWRMGNPKLLGPVTNSANIEYITDWSKGLHRIVFNLKAELNRRDRVIENIILFDSSKGVPYVYPVNTSYGDVMGMTAMLNYSYGAFSMSLGGNLFYNTEYSLEDKSRGGYFNIMFAPSIQLENNWLINANYQYNSEVYTGNAILGECSILAIRINKVLGKWTLFSAIGDVFDGISTDVEYLDGEVLYRTYDPYIRSFTVGASVRL